MTKVITGNVASMTKEVQAYCERQARIEKLYIEHPIEVVLRSEYKVVVTHKDVPVQEEWVTRASMVENISRNDNWDYIVTGETREVKGTEIQRVLDVQTVYDRLTEDDKGSIEAFGMTVDEMVEMFEDVNGI